LVLFRRKDDFSTDGDRYDSRSFLQVAYQQGWFGLQQILIVHLHVGIDTSKLIDLPWMRHYSIIGTAGKGGESSKWEKSPFF